MSYIKPIRSPLASSQAGIGNQVGLQLTDLSKILSTWQATTAIRTAIEPSISAYVSRYPDTQIMIQYKAANVRWSPVPTGFVTIRSESTYRIALRPSKVQLTELTLARAKGMIPGMLIGGLLGFLIAKLIPTTRR
jgi:hypothetical protein